MVKSEISHEKCATNIIFPHLRA